MASLLCVFSECDNKILKKYFYTINFDFIREPILFVQFELC